MALLLAPPGAEIKLPAPTKTEEAEPRREAAPPSPPLVAAALKGVRGGAAEDAAEELCTVVVISCGLLWVETSPSVIKARRGAALAAGPDAAPDSTGSEARNRKSSGSEFVSTGLC